MRRKMCTLMANSKPKTLLRKDSSVVIGWENVFACASKNCSYVLEILDDFCEWNQIYRGQKQICTVEKLAPSSFFNFRLKCDTGKTEWLEFKSGTDTEQYYVRHLTRAIQFSKTALIRKIIGSRPILLETENLENKTPLIQATETGDFAIVNFLLNLGAKVNQETIALKRTAFMLCVYHGHLEIAQLLINKGADINMKDTNGMTALHFAVDSGNVDNVKFVLKYSPDVNSKDNKGWTPLLRARASDDVVALLLDNSTDYPAKDNKGFDFVKHTELVGRTYLNVFINSNNSNNNS